MKSKKILQLERDLRLVVSTRSFHFGNEKKQSWWKRRRKLILGTTAAVVATSAIVGGSIYYNKRKAEELEKSKNLTEEQKAKKIKQEEEQRERDQKDEENKLKQASRESEKERTKQRLILLEKERKLKEAQDEVQKNPTPENKEKVKNILEKIEEAKQKEFRNLVEEEKNKILSQINDLKTLPTEELAKIATLPRGFFEKMLDYGENAKEKIKEFFSRAKSNSSKPKEPKEQKPQKEQKEKKEKKTDWGGIFMDKIQDLSPETSNKLVSVLTSVAGFALKSNTLKEYAVNKLAQHLGLELEKAPLGTAEGAKDLIATGVPVNALGPLAATLAGSGGGSIDSNIITAGLSALTGRGTPVPAFSASGIQTDTDRIANSAGVNPNLLKTLVPALTQSGGTITPDLLKTVTQAAGGLSPDMISQFAPSLLQHAGVNIPVDSGVGDKNEPKTVKKALDENVNPQNVLTEAMKNPQLTSMFQNPIAQKILAGFLGGGGGKLTFGKDKFGKLTFGKRKNNKVDNKLKELLNDYALLTGRRLNKFGHMMDSYPRGFLQEPSVSSTPSKTTKVGDGSFTPEMMPNITISLPQQIQLVELVTRFYKPTGNSILDTLIKPFLNFVKLTNDEKNKLVGKIVSYFQILYNNYINKGVVPQEVHQLNNQLKEKSIINQEYVPDDEELKISAAQQRVKDAKDAQNKEYILYELKKYKNQNSTIEEYKNDRTKVGDSRESAQHEEKIAILEKLGMTDKMTIKEVISILEGGVSRSHKTTEVLPEPVEVNADNSFKKAATNVKSVNKLKITDEEKQRRINAGAEKRNQRASKGKSEEGDRETELKQLIEILNDLLNKMFHKDLRDKYKNKYKNNSLYMSDIFEFLRNRNYEGYGYDDAFATKLYKDYFEKYNLNTRARVPDLFKEINTKIKNEPSGRRYDFGKRRNKRIKRKM